MNVLRTPFNNLHSKKDLASFISEGAACVLSQIWFFASPQTAAHQAPLSIEFPRQEYWSGLPFPTPGDLPDPGMEQAFLALAGRFFTTEPSRKSIWVVVNKNSFMFQRK